MDSEEATEREHEAAGGQSIQIFAAPSDAPRVRWRTDLISAGFVATVLGVLILVAGEGATLDSSTLEFVGSLPGWFLWLGQAAYEIGVLYALGLLVGIAFVARGRLSVARDMLLAAALSVVFVVLLTQLIDERWPEFAFLDLGQTRETFPAFFVTMATATQAAASPWLTAPMRKIGWIVILAAASAAVFGAVTTVSDTLGGVLVGLLAAALTRWTFGTSAGVPSTARLRAGLADIGVSTTSLHYFTTRLEGATLLSGTRPDGGPIFVNCLGRDAWSTRRWSQLWRRAWYQDQGSQHGSDRRQFIEHEALVLLLAHQSDVDAPSLVGVGMSRVDDALVVTDLFDHTLEDLDSVDDGSLDEIWELVASLHRAGIGHGSIDDIHIWFTPAGTMQLAGFSDAVINPSTDQRLQDVAATLVMTATLVGADRAIVAARRSIGDEVLAEMLPVLQTASLNGRLRSRARHAKLKVADLKEATADALGVELPQARRLTRVTWKNVLMVTFIGFAVYTIIGGLADVGFDTIWQALLDARWGLVLLGLVFAAATNWTDAIALSAVAPKPVPIGITTVQQFAIGFVNMAVPSAAGRVATNVRYFEKFGINAVTSTTSGVITGLLGFVVQASLVVVTTLVGAGSIDLSALSFGGGFFRLLAMAVVVFIGIAVVVAVVPKLRRLTVEKLREPLNHTKPALAVLKAPKTAATALGAAFGTELLYASGLVMCVLAVGGSVNLGEAIFINVTVSLFAGLMPIPGGIGVTEAGLTAGLTAVGVPSDIAVSAVLIYRLVSYYLPPIWGWFSLRWLVRKDYL